MKHPPGNLLLFIFPAICLCILLSGCNNKELEYPAEGNVLDVKFEWDNDDVFSPEGMTLIFYPTTSRSQCWRFEVSGKNGGKVELPYGEYELLAFNNDNRLVWFSNTENMLSCCANLYCSDDNISRPISPLYRGMVTKIHFSPQGVSYYNDESSSEVNSSFPILVCFPRRVSTQYNILVKDVEGIENVRSATFRMEGIRSGLMLCDNEPVGKDVSIYNIFSVDKDRNVFSCRFSSFRCVHDVSMPVKLIVDVQTYSQKIYRKTFDVTNEVLNSKDSLNVNLVIENLSVPDDNGSAEEGVDISVGVDGWTEIIIDYYTKL